MKIENNVNSKMFQAIERTIATELETVTTNICEELIKDFTDKLNREKNRAILNAISNIHISLEEIRYDDKIQLNVIIK